MLPAFTSVVAGKWFAQSKTRKGALTASAKTDADEKLRTGLQGEVEPR